MLLPCTARIWPRSESAGKRWCCRCASEVWHVGGRTRGKVRRLQFGRTGHQSLLVQCTPITPLNSPTGTKLGNLVQQLHHDGGDPWLAEVRAAGATVIAMVRPQAECVYSRHEDDSSHLPETFDTTSTNGKQNITCLYIAHAAKCQRFWAHLTMRHNILDNILAPVARCFGALLRCGVCKYWQECLGQAFNLVSCIPARS
jgi:hypothetical protein